MKKNFAKIIAVVLAALMVAALFTACGKKNDEPAGKAGEENGENNENGENGENGENNEAGVKGENTEWGKFAQIFVPETMDFTGGTQLDKESEDGFQLADKENPTRKWIMVDLVAAESAEGSLAATREMNENSEDFTVELGGVTWTGVAYKYADTDDAFQMYATIGEQTVMIRSFGYAYNSDLVKAFVDGLKLA